MESEQEKSLSPDDVFILGVDGGESLPKGVEAVAWGDILPEYFPNGNLKTHPKVDIRTLRLHERRVLLIVDADLLQKRIRGNYEYFLTQAVVSLLLSVASPGEIVFMGRWWIYSDWLLMSPHNTLDVNTYGQTIGCENEDWAFYFKHVQRYSGAVKRAAVYMGSTAKEILRKLLGAPYEPCSSCEAIASNGHGQMIGVAVHLALRTLDLDDCPQETPTGRCILLPWPNRELIEMVNLILSERYGFRAGSTRPPLWLDDVPKLPTEITYREQLAQMEAERLRLTREIQEKQESFEEWSQIKKLLYTQDKELERAVWETLRLLGADELEEEPRGNQEDSIFLDVKGRAYISDTKGLVNRRAKKKDLTQLHGFREDRWREEIDLHRRKPIAIINHEFSKSPTERSEDCLGAEQEAVRLEVCCVSTLQLYRALMAKEKGTFNAESFWDSIHSAVGVWRPGTDILPPLD